VVQFREETDVVGQGRFAGRVEHVVSGQATHFHSLEELLAFIARVLADVRTQSPGQPGEPPDRELPRHPHVSAETLMRQPETRLCLNECLTRSGQKWFTRKNLCQSRG
jgi:hypothetical protein